MESSLTRPVYVSAISAFEIATKVRLSKLNMPASLLSDFQYVVEADGFRVLPLDVKSAMTAGEFASQHRDPFDRLLAAQALTHECAVVTPDHVFEAEFGVPVVW